MTKLIQEGVQKSREEIIFHKNVIRSLISEIEDIPKDGKRDNPVIDDLYVKVNLHRDRLRKSRTTFNILKDKLRR